MSFMAIYVAREVRGMDRAGFEENVRMRRLVAEQRLQRRAERLADRADRINRRAAKADFRLARESH